MVTGRRDGGEGAGGGGGPKTRMLQEIGHLREGGGGVKCTAIADVAMSNIEVQTHL